MTHDDYDHLRESADAAYVSRLPCVQSGEHSDDLAHAIEVARGIGRHAPKQRQDTFEHRPDGTIVNVSAMARITSRRRW